MEKNALLSALGAHDALPLGDLLNYNSDEEAQYRRAVDLWVGLGLIDETTLTVSDSLARDPSERFETFYLVGGIVKVMGPFDVLAATEALRAATSPVEKLAGVEVIVDGGIRATLTGPVAEGIATTVREAASSATLAAVGTVVAANVIPISRARQETAGDVL